jgi:hypothetical protein
VVSYIGPCGPAVTLSPASERGSEPAPELSLARSYTTNGDATVTVGFLSILGPAVGLPHVLETAPRLLRPALRSI